MVTLERTDAFYTWSWVMTMELFSPGKLDVATRAMLTDVGWHPDRHVDMTEKALEFEIWGISMHSRARSILESLNGLIVEPVGPEGANFHVDKIKFDPDLSADSYVIQELFQRFQEDFFPVARMYVDGIFVSSSGLTVCSLEDEIWIVGHSFEEALDRLVCVTGRVERFMR